MSNQIQSDQKPSSARADFAGAVFLILFVLMLLGVLDSLLMRIMTGPETTNPFIRAGNELLGLNNVPAKMRAENWLGFACFAATISFLVACTIYGVLSFARGVFLFPASISNEIADEPEHAHDNQLEMSENKNVATT